MIWAAADIGSLNTLIQYGVLGLIVIVLVPFVKWLIKREMDRSDRQEVEVNRLNLVIQERDRVVQDRIIPALLSATKAVEVSTELWAAHQRDLEVRSRAVEVEQARRLLLELEHERGKNRND